MGQRLLRPYLLVIMLLTHHQLRLFAAVQEKSACHIKLVLIVNLPSSQILIKHGKSAIAVQLVTIVMVLLQQQ